MDQDLDGRNFKLLAAAALARWKRLAPMDIEVADGSLKALARQVGEAHGIPVASAHQQLQALFRSLSE